jgi:hypothetical protein
MSFLIYLLIFFILPYFSASYKYGIIRNAEIELYSDTPKNLGHQLEVNDCNDCICNAFSKSLPVNFMMVCQHVMKLNLQEMI